ncbi:MAG: transglutaminase domain-containing protein [Rhodoferax sp.]|nr:transglutaminase domain-containing protein [Rhodoferax sp.]
MALLTLSGLQSSVQRGVCAGLLIFSLVASAYAQTPAAGDAQRWREVDLHALAAPASVEQDMTALTSYLTDRFTKPEEKLRAVYRWVTDRIAYDVAAFYADRSSFERPGDILQHRVSACEGYSELYGAMLHQAGVPVLRINGYVKDSRHLAGEPYLKTNHAWNAVQINGQWRLIDATWGAGYDDGARFVKRFEPNYFLTDPATLSLSHFAENPTYRFQNRTTTLREFEHLTYVPNTLLNTFNPALLEQVLRTPLPKTFNHPPGTFYVDQAPVSGELSAGQAVDIRIRSDVLKTFAVLNNDNWTMFAVKPEGTVIHIVPVAGPFVILGQRPNTENYVYLLQYQVRP